jgi:hypothetical protein
MLHALEEYEIVCPYCGEPFSVVIDCSVPRQDYIEDCEICCRPINFDVAINDAGDLHVGVYSENDSFP